MPLSLLICRNVSWRLALRACRFLQAPELYLPPSKQYKVCCVVKSHSVTRASSYQARKKEKQTQRKKGQREEERPREPGAPCIRVNAHPNILTPRGKRGATAEPSSALAVPSLHSAMGSCEGWRLGHTAEGRANHFDQIRRSTKITRDQGEELKPI